MKKRPHGPSLYYASDKNVFDALNQHKVNTETLVELFERRNIVVSKKTPRDKLAAYFSRQIHDYEDHKAIARRLGVTPRRERITSMELAGSIASDQLAASLQALKDDLESTNEVVQIARDGDRINLTIQYSTVDYRVSEFAQRQERDGTIELIRTATGYTIRNTQNEYMNDVTAILVAKLETAAPAPLEKITVSLFDVPSARHRSRFFHELAFRLPGYQQSDVTAVYVYKARPETSSEGDPDDDAGDDDSTDGSPHIERVHLRGQGVTRSELLNELLEKDDYYITKIAWGAREIGGAGHDYDIEATFADPKQCTGFSFILSGVYPFEDGVHATRRRPPYKPEIDQISRVVESHAREIAARLRQEWRQQQSQEAVRAE